MKIDWDRALLRGEFVAVAAMMEHAGIPLDTATLSSLTERWADIQWHFAYLTALRYPRTFEGTRFSIAGLGWYADRAQMPWPQHPDGTLKVDDDTFRDMVRAFPHLRQLRDARRMMAQLRASKLTVGKDGRNRTVLWPFASKTGRSQPSASEFIFGQPSWMRHLIKPGVGFALAYLDFTAMEFLIAAVLSGDLTMLRVYEDGDPYIGTAILGGGAQEGATKETHPEIRDRFKTATLAPIYGQSAFSLAERLAIPEAYADDLLRRLRRTYPRFFEWTEHVATTAAFTGKMTTRFGWSIQVGFPHAELDGVNVASLYARDDRSVKNWPVQSCGADILRLSAILASRRGITLLASVHDALLIEARDEELSGAVQITRQSMEDASRIVLEGHALRVDVQDVRYPKRFTTKKGKETWAQVMRIVGLTP